MPNVFDRLSAAYKALRFAAEPSASGVTVWSSMNAWQSALWQSYQGTQKNYSVLVGDLSQASLPMAAVRWVGNTLPEARLVVREDVNAQEDDEPVAEHPLITLLERPNLYTSGKTMWKAFAFSWVLSGNVYFLKVRNNAGQVIELWYEPHWSIRPLWPIDGSEFISAYQVDRGTEKITIPLEDVVHFRDGIDPLNPRFGLSTLVSILREIYGDNEAANYYAQLVGGNAVPPLIATINNKDGALAIEEEDIKNIKANLVAQTKGDRRGEPLVVENLDIKKLAFSPQEMDIRVSRYLAEERFCAVTGIPGVLMELGSAGEHSIYNNVKQASERGTTNYLVPLWGHIAEELTNQLLPDFDSNQRRFVAHDLSKVAALQEDEDAKHARVREDYKAEMIMRSTAMRMLGQKPADDGSDDVFYTANRQTVTANVSPPNGAARNGRGAATAPGNIRNLLTAQPQ